MPAAAKPTALHPPADLNKVLLRAIKDGDLATAVACCEAHGELDLERRSMWDNTPLTCAAYYGREDIALKLLEMGSEPCAENEQGCTALLYAAVEGMPRLMRALLARPSITADVRAATVYSRLTDETAPRTPVLAAVECGFAEGVEMLLARMPALAHPDASGLHPLALAARRGHAQVCRLLLAAGASATQLGSQNSAAPATLSPLRAAIANSHTEAALAIVAHAPAAAAAEPELVPLAVLKASAEHAVLKALVAAGASVDARADDGSASTALHVAARRNDAACVRILLALGADATALDGDGRSARQLAEQNGHDEVCAVFAAS
jgi:ankyrin repeat protein